MGDFTKKRCDMNIPMTNWGPRWTALESIVSAIYLYIVISLYLYNIYIIQNLDGFDHNLTAFSVTGVMGIGFPLNHPQMTELFQANYQMLIPILPRSIDVVFDSEWVLIPARPRLHYDC